MLEVNLERDELGRIVTQSEAVGNDVKVTVFTYDVLAARQRADRRCARADLRIR